MSELHLVLESLELPTNSRLGCAPPQVCLMHVLLLEDNFLLAELLCDALEQWGHSVSLVAAAESGRQLALVEHFDCAILDIQVEGGFSFDLADLLSEQGVQFLFCSGGHRDLIPAHHLSRPFLQKPYTMSELWSALKFGSH